MKKLSINMRPLVLIAGLTLALTPVHGQDDKGQSSTKEEGNRNVMLNASSANGPREIQIGLPSSDVNVLENGLPVTYATNPHSVNTIWRGDASLSHNGLLKISETAITTGNIGYAVNSFTQLGLDGFHTTINYKMNHFGQQEMSMNLNGGIGKGWYYSVNMYQDFDPGTFKIKSSDYQDRTQIYKFALTKRYAGNRGELTAMWEYANSHPAYSYATQSAPFIYKGDGGVKEYGNFKLGTTSYLPVNGDMVYVDMKDGKQKTTSLYDFIENRTSNFSLLNTYKWDNGLMLRTMLRFDHARGALVYQTPMSLIDVAGNNSYAYKYRDAMGQEQTYNGKYVQTRMSCLNSGSINELLFTNELSKKFSTSVLRIGLNEWYYHIDYTSNTTMYDQSVPDDGSYAIRLYDSNLRNTYFYDFNHNASEFYRGHENKLALYVTHDWDITPKFNIYYGARLEYQKLNGKNAADTEGKYTRFNNYYIGATNDRVQDNADTSRLQLVQL